MKLALDDMTAHYKDLCLDAVRRELEYNRYQGQTLACDSAIAEIQEIYNGADKKLKDKIAEYNEKIKEVERKRGNRVEQLKRLANEFESKVGKYQELKVELVELDARINVLSNVVSKVSDLTEKQAKCKNLEQTYQKMLNHYKQSLTEGVQEETRALIYSTHVENLSKIITQNNIANGEKSKRGAETVQVLSADGLLAQILKKIERYEAHASQLSGVPGMMIAPAQVHPVLAIDAIEGSFNLNESISRVEERSMLDVGNTSEIKEIKEDIEKLREILEASIKQQESTRATPVKQKPTENSEEETRVTTIESAKISGILESTMQNQLTGIEVSLKQQIEKIIKENTEEMKQKIKDELEETRVIQRKITSWNPEDERQDNLRSLRDSFLMNSAGKDRAAAKFNLRPPQPASRRLERRHSSVIPSIPDYPEMTYEHSSQHEAGDTSSDQEEVNVEELGDKVPKFLAVPVISPPKLQHAHNRQRSFDMVSIMSAVKPTKVISLPASTQTIQPALHLESCVGVLIRHGTPTDKLKHLEGDRGKLPHLTMQPLTGLQLAPQKRFRHPISVQNKHTQTNILKTQMEVSVQTEHAYPWSRRQQFEPEEFSAAATPLQTDIQVDEISAESRDDVSPRIEVSKEISTPSDAGQHRMRQTQAEIDSESADFSKALTDILRTSLIYVHLLTKVTYGGLARETSEIVANYMSAQIESLKRIKQAVMKIDRQGFLLFVHFESERLSKFGLYPRKFLGYFLFFV